MMQVSVAKPSSGAGGYRRRDCPACGAASAAVEIDYDMQGSETVLICFACGERRQRDEAGETRSTLRHKCRVRLLLG